MRGISRGRSLVRASGHLCNDDPWVVWTAHRNRLIRICASAGHMSQLLMGLLVINDNVVVIVNAEIDAIHGPGRDW